MSKCTYLDFSVWSDHLFQGYSSQEYELGVLNISKHSYAMLVNYMAFPRTKVYNRVSCATYTR